MVRGPFSRPVPRRADSRCRRLPVLPGCPQKVCGRCWGGDDGLRGAVVVVFWTVDRALRLPSKDKTTDNAVVVHPPCARLLVCTFKRGDVQVHAAMKRKGRNSSHCWCSCLGGALVDIRFALLVCTHVH